MFVGHEIVAWIINVMQIADFVFSKKTKKQIKRKKPTMCNGCDKHGVRERERERWGIGFRGEAVRADLVWMLALMGKMMS